MKYYSENQIMEIAYDTSFLRRLKCVIDGIESNPGPTSSVESYRASIGHFYSKARKIGKSNICSNEQLVNITLFLYLIMFLPLIIYGLTVTTIYHFPHFLTFFVAIVIVYGYPIMIICISLDLVAHKFEKFSNNNRLFRKPNGMLVHYKYKDTFLLDGRDRNRFVQMNLCLGNEGIFWLTDEKPCIIDNVRMYRAIVNLVSFMLHLSGLLFFCT